MIFLDLVPELKYETMKKDFLFNTGTKLAHAQINDFFDIFLK